MSNANIEIKTPFFYKGFWNINKAKDNMNLLLKTINNTDVSVPQKVVAVNALQHIHGDKYAYITRISFLQSLLCSNPTDVNKALKLLFTCKAESLELANKPPRDIEDFLKELIGNEANYRNTYQIAKRKLGIN